MVNTYAKLKAYAEQENLHIYDIDIEWSFQGVPCYYRCTFLYELTFGEFRIISAHNFIDGSYYYVPPAALLPFYSEIQKEVWCLDELEEEREARREAYRDQRDTA